MTEQEYLQRLSELFEKIQQAVPTGDKTTLFERYQEAEFDLTVDYRLGYDFPAERRMALCAVHKLVMDDIEKLKALYQKGELSNEAFAAALQEAAQGLKKEYSKVLTEEEMLAFFGEGENAFCLPIMPEAL